MPERPLLLFPTPQLADRTRRVMPQFGRVHKPDITRQGQRLSPMFNQLQAAFKARKVEIQQNAAGTDPEQVLVIETIGSVEDFAKAVKRIQGFEWMGELEIDNIAPDQDFYDEEHPGKKLDGRLYLVMTNQQALDEMLSLWQRYLANPNMQSTGTCFLSWRFRRSAVQRPAPSRIASTSVGIDGSSPTVGHWFRKFRRTFTVSFHFLCEMPK